MSLLALGPAVVYGKGKKPKGTDGSYKVTVGGDHTGSGSGTVSGNKITITVQVTDDAGNKGTFKADLKIDGAHFEGDGTVMGRKMTITGRLDGYSNSRGFRGARLLGSYTDESGKTGRVAGVIDAKQ